MRDTWLHGWVQRLKMDAGRWRRSHKTQFLHRCLMDANELTRSAMIQKTECVGCRTFSLNAVHGTTLNTFLVRSGACMMKVGGCANERTLPCRELNKRTGKVPQLLGRCRSSEWWVLWETRIGYLFSRRPLYNPNLVVFGKLLGLVGPDTVQVSRVITPEISLLLDCVTLEFRLRRKSTVMQTRLLWYIS